jgi:copper transport protein
MRGWRAILLCAIGVLALSGAPAASAHAKLIRANPAPNAVLGQAPTQVQLWFDEPLEIAFSKVQVLDGQRQNVETGEFQLAADDPKSLIVALKPTGDGSYTVLWQVLSAADGHITRGVFAFGVGTAAGPAAAPIDSSAFVAPPVTPPVTVVRWLNLLSLMALAGGFIFKPLLLDRSLLATGSGAEVTRVANRRWVQLTAFAFAVFFLASHLELLSQAEQAAGHASVSSVLGVLSQSRFGTLWLMRLGLMLVAAAVFYLSVRGVRIPEAPYALIVLGNVALITRSLLGHAAASGNFSPPVFVDWLHLLAAAVWVGGLLYLAFVAPFVWHSLETERRGKWLAWLISQFSAAAIGATLVLVATGLFSTMQQIPALAAVRTGGALPALPDLLSGLYVNALTVKLVLFAIMVVFGAVNLLWISPRFRRFVNEPDKNARLFSRFRATLGAEVVLGLGAILLAGLLTLATPPRSTPTDTGPGVTENGSPRATVLVGYAAPDVRVEFEMGPDAARPERFMARVTDANGSAPADIQRVLFNFMYLEEDAGAQNVTAELEEGTGYVAEGENMPLEGMWRVRVTVRRRGLEDMTVTFPYYIAPREATGGETDVMTARLLLIESENVMNALESVRSKQELNDGAAGLAISHYEYEAPDRTRFRIEGQGESIAVGDRQFLQNPNGQWVERERVDPFKFPSFDYARAAQAVRMGRPDTLNGMPTQIVLFQAPTTSGAEQIEYAYWIEEGSKRVVQLAMVANAHYMMQSYRDFDAEIAITAPPNAISAPTAVAAAPSQTGGNLPTNASPRPRGIITGDLEGDGALVMVVAGIVILLAGTGGKRTRQARLVTIAIGAASVLGGIALFIDAVNATSALANTPVDMMSASTGQRVYVERCAVCHGQQGRGDGPGGADLPVKPFDLTTHALQHDEQYLFVTILNGRGYMPAFGSQLTQDEILDVVSYIRLLALQAGQAPGAPGSTPRPGFTPQP